MKKIKVGVVGYGTIGKRVADAVLLQEDMELVGISGRSYNFRMESANRKGIPIFLVHENRQFQINGIKPAGLLKDLLNNVDVIVDCTPKKSGKENKFLYEQAGVKAVYQGGEKSDIGVSFVAQCNYNEALNKQHIRVVSCNTTGLCRTLHAINQKYPIKRVRATLIRRATDPADPNRGPINSIVPSLELPSHHGHDVRTVLHDIEVFTTAVIVPTTLMHIHNLSVELKDDESIDHRDIIALLKEAPRIRIVRTEEEITSTSEILELARDEGYNRGDMMDVCIWQEGLGVHGKEIFFTQAIHQESIVVPESIDAIRAAVGFPYAEKSIEMTNKSLRLK